MSFPAEINHQMLVEARRRAGYRLSLASKALKIDKKTLEAYEKGRRKLDFDELQKLSKLYRFSLSFFYTSSPQKISSSTDLYFKKNTIRRISLGPQLAWELRLMTARVELLQEQLVTEGKQPLDWVGSTAQGKTDEGALALGKTIRKRLGITFDEQQTLENEGEALRFWIERAESIGVFVFQSDNSNDEGIQLDAFRGCALYNEFAPAILLNSHDGVLARVFTIAHELAHLWLGESHLNKNILTEDFCNRVASEILVPKDRFHQHWKDIPRYNDIWDKITTIAKDFKVSPFSILVKAKNDSMISEDELSTAEFNRLVDHLNKEWEARERKKIAERESGDSPPAPRASWLRKKIYLLGKPFVQRLRASHEQEETSTSYAGVLADIAPQLVFDLFDTLDEIG